MEIALAKEGDFSAIKKYDCHIPASRLKACIGAHQVYILRDGSRVVGVLRYSLFWQSIPFLDLMYLDEAYRGKGYGRQMMAQWEQDMKRGGFSHCMLSTQADESGKFFYEKLGYRQIGAFLPPDQAADELMYLKAF